MSYSCNQQTACMQTENKFSDVTKKKEKGYNTDMFTHFDLLNLNNKGILRSTMICYHDITLTKYAMQMRLC